jgi:beta-lactamase regulating signal transducer with metallopeptidase domain
MIYLSLTFAFCLIAISALHATIIDSALVALAIVAKQRRPALAHAMLFGASLSLIALPFAIMASRNQAWQRLAIDTSLRSQDPSGVRKDIAKGSVTASPKMPIDLTTKTLEDTHKLEEGLPNYSSSESNSGNVTTHPGPVTIPNSMVKEVAIPSTPDAGGTVQTPVDPTSVGTYFFNIWQPALAVVWFLGVAYLCLKLAVAFIYLRRITLRASQAEKNILDLTEHLAVQFEVCPPRVVVSNEVKQPMLWGVRLVTVILPDSHDAWTEQELSMILSHEMAHIHRGDHWSKIVNQVVLALYWFHPLVHLHCRLSESLAELSADDLSILSGSKGIELSECLMKLASSEKRSAIALQFASYRELKGRLERLVSDQHVNFRIGKLGRAIQFSLAAIVPIVLSVCIGLGESQSANAIQNTESQQPNLVTTPIDIAVASMAKKPAWSHLPLDLDAQVKKQVLSGPEFNLQVRIVDQEKTPVPGALCAIVENQSERVNRRPFSKNGNLKLESLPLSLAVTNDQGECFFERIRGRHPSSRDNGIVQTMLVVLQPEYGFRVVALKRSNRMQTISLELESGKILTGEVSDSEGKPLADVSIEIGLSKQRDRFGTSMSIFGKTSILSPIVSTNKDGVYVLEGLPPEHDVTLIPSRFAFEIANDKNAITTADVSTSARHLDIKMRRTEKQAMRFQCVDSQGNSTPAIPTIGIPPGSELAVDADGNFVTYAYETFGNGTRILRLNLPSPWLSLSAVRRTDDFKEPFELPVMRGRSVRGKVIDATTSLPIGGVPIFGREKVSQEPLDEHKRNAGPYQTWRTETLTNQLGEFELFVSHTAWHVLIDGPVFGYELDEPSVENPNEFFEVAAGKESPNEFTFKLRPKKRIRGIVIGSDGKPMPNAEVACSYFATELNETVAMTNTKGEFEVIPPPGVAKQYELRAAAGSEHTSMILSQDWDQNTPQSLNLHLKPMEEERVIEGIILVDGEGKAGVEVAIGKGENRTLAYGGAFIRSVRNGYVANATTDSSGKYRIVVPQSEHGHADFHIIAPPDLATGWQTPTVSLDRKVNAGPKLEFITKPGKKKIRGKVLSVAGVPFEGAIIYLELANHNARTISGAKRETRTVKTNDKGEFEFTDLVDASYQLQAQSPLTNNLWNLVVRKICKAGDPEVVLIMDRQFLEPPEKLVPQKRN